MKITPVFGKIHYDEELISEYCAEEKECETNEDELNERQSAQKRLAF